MANYSCKKFFPTTYRFLSTVGQKLRKCGEISGVRNVISRQRSLATGVLEQCLLASVARTRRTDQSDDVKLSLTAYDT